ncbi:MAG TPA: ABC transporter ATP-binding protein [Kiritimatiellia bacterium]|nr:ABC transporter ATP-binding protein [Kiritimatiellia bacterium]OQC59045.1 MAG: Spermidine/putrescine import ATP-binding protein PotA [Verrucomicrobia bacterium ADurb.Bin018]MBP9571798.1 ABC transporter ATP-binding protein [Kiritimatiellia bacterium]HOE01288.1 ABC transporter ATP-binding protein [Kiritimatiellia bacterium]HOE36844.1 ABC transporter ATP-binding protein [Kiritimatiellia bacterium]
MSEFLEFQDVSKHYGDVKAVDHVSLTVKQGEFFSLLGPSGCGKTTLLRILAGFEQPDTGRVLLGGEDVTDLPPYERKVNTIFQSYALFPHLSVWDNIAFGLKVAKRPKKEIKEEVAKMLTLIQMEDQAWKKPDQISGGQKQRVAIARALVNKPRVLLLDEPLAALDLKLRQRMLIELDLIHDEVGITFLYVTHDQGEAMSLSDRIAVMKLGKIEQLGTPEEIYEAPRSSFVAAFIGDTNFFDGTVAEPLEKDSVLNGFLAAAVDKDYSRLKIEDFPDLECFNDKQIKEGERVFLSIRPEKMRISRERPATTPHLNIIAGTVEDVIYLGSQTKYWVRTGDYRISIIRQHSRFLLDEKPIRWHEEVWISWHADDGFMLEKYSAQDENLIQLPPEEVGENPPSLNGADLAGSATAQ